MKSRWIVHKSHRIMYSDFTHFGRDLDALREEVAAADEEICRQPLGTVLVLNDVTGTTTSAAAVMIFKESAARTKGWIIRQAIVGASGIQRILASAVARFSKEDFWLFDDVEEAKDWLASGQGKGQEIRAM